MSAPFASRTSINVVLPYKNKMYTEDVKINGFFLMDDFSLLRFKYGDASI